mgnify:CR=1 FL=1
MEKINEECKIGRQYITYLCFFNIKELVTNLLYIFHILITPSANNWYLEIRPSWARVYKFYGRN